MKRAKKKTRWREQISGELHKGGIWNRSMFIYIRQSEAHGRVVALIHMSLK